MEKQLSRLPHKQKIVGANPTAATILKKVEMRSNYEISTPFDGLEDALNRLYAIVGKDVQICLIKPAGYDDWTVSVAYESRSHYVPAVAIEREIERLRAEGQ